MLAMLTPIVTESRRLSPHATQRGLVRPGLRQARPVKMTQLPPRAGAGRPRPASA
jgi:hypothetical protein